MLSRRIGKLVLCTALAPLAVVWSTHGSVSGADEKAAAKTKAGAKESAAAKDKAASKETTGATEKATADKPKAKGRLPAHYAGVVDETQREKIYKIQASYAKRLDKLKADLQALTDKRDAEIAAVLTDEQRATLEELVAAAGDDEEEMDEEAEEGEDDAEDAEDAEDDAEAEDEESADAEETESAPASKAKAKAK